MKVLCQFVLTVSLLSAPGVPQATQPDPPPAWNAVQTAAAIRETLRSHLYDPAETGSAAYLSAMGGVQALAEAQPDRAGFVEGFNRIWADGPFSHVRLEVARASADQTAAYLDKMRVGGRGATLEWKGDVAVLTVTTMMGADTIEQIGAAYRAMAERQARALVIDLRRNEGGAFAVVPLVSHVLPSELDAGAFLGAGWFAGGRSLPVRREFQSTPAWEGWSLRAFWGDIERQGALCIRFRPAEPRFAGPVYVLTSARTASAAELAADALQARGRATVVGETTAGKLLSQKMFDVPGGLQLSLPVADYLSWHGGRIEGRGVVPDVEVEAARALDVALGLSGACVPSSSELCDGLQPSPGDAGRDPG